MLRVFLVLSLLMAASLVQADDAKKIAASASFAEAIVAKFSNTRDEAELAKADSAIEKAWQDYIRYHATNNELGKELALIRARSASSKRDKKRVASAWETALQLQPLTINSMTRLNLNVQAANASAAAGDYSAANRYFSAAQTYAFLQDRDTRALQLNLKINELRALGPQMEWRRLRDNLLDMRLFSEGFSLWTLPRLEALVSEAEMRVALQPEDKGKREALGELKSKIQLTMKNMSNILTAPYVNRVRNFYYTIEDYYGL